MFGCADRSRKSGSEHTGWFEAKGNLERLRSGDVSGKVLLVGAALQKGNFYDCYSDTTGPCLG